MKTERLSNTSLTEKSMTRKVRGSLKFRLFQGPTFFLLLYRKVTINRRGPNFS